MHVLTVVGPLGSHQMSSMSAYFSLYKMRLKKKCFKRMLVALTTIDLGLMK